MAFCELQYNSYKLGKQMTTWAILPEVSGPWSVLYLLHGRSDNHTAWMRHTSIERYAEKYPSLMIVMPDQARSFSINALNGGAAYQDGLIEDLIPFIDRTFRTRAERSGRAIGGLSMGGYGSLKIALQFPQLFASVHSHSGATDFAHGWRDQEEETVLLLGTEMSGGSHDLYRLSEECKNPPAMWIDCGTDDFLLESNRSYHAHLEKIKFPHEYHEYALGHGWDYWDTHIQDALAFHARHLGLTSKN